MKKINFKQPKYIFPAVVAIPIIGLAYFVWQMFGGGETTVETPTDRINMELPEARVDEVGDKLSSMQSRYNRDNAFTEMEAIGREIETKEDIDAFSDKDIESMIEEAQQKEIERKERQRLEQLERQLSQNNSRLPEDPYGSYSAYQAELEKIQQNSMARQKEILKQQEEEEKAKKEEAERIAREKEELAKKNQPLLVEKADIKKGGNFNTVSITTPSDETPLIRAMIDVTTKAHEGTRLRFKLLDDVIVDDIKLLKGTYLYGTVSGFGQQRVMAHINNILVGNRFLKVDLSVFDNDGMEGFYVPSSAFRDFMKQAGGSVLGGNNMQFTTGSNYGSGINGEYLALQALQNVYQSATQAIGANLRKNKAKIKYNTIVYLINSREARH